MRCAIHRIALAILLSSTTVVGSTYAQPQEIVKISANRLSADALQLLKDRCGKCHGPASPESELMMMTFAGVARGGESGKVITPGDLENSSLWQRVADDEMPPEEPLDKEERHLLQAWIEAGAPGLETGSGNGEHWAFRQFSEIVPPPNDDSRLKNLIDHFISARLTEHGLQIGVIADRAKLIRRVSYDLTGLPPTPAEIATYMTDNDENAYERMIERFLASPNYGERWGGHWLDTAGYADSNGYFNADTDRPLAYRYRDYVVRSFNADKPFDRFIHEQLAGDELAELAGYKPDGKVTPQVIELFEATHYLRNSQDGTDSSDGNPDELKTDKYKVLEGTLQIIGSSLLGLKLQCARCHEHKFEPIEQHEYYQLQAIFYPALNVDDWVKPKERMIYAAMADDLANWEDDMAQLDAEKKTAQEKFDQWVENNREKGVTIFQDQFDDPQFSLSTYWNNTAPDSETPLGSPPVALTSDKAPAANITSGQLNILESGQTGDRALSTRHAFDWTPDRKNDWIQVSFDLIADQIEDSSPAARMAYFISLIDFHDDAIRGGNLLIDGNPSGGAAVHLRYPGSATSPTGTIGNQKYQPGHNYGIRVTNIGEEGYRLEHLVDGGVEGESIILKAIDLPNGGFGFEYCCGRSFIVDNVLVETNDPAIDVATREKYQDELAQQRKLRDEAVAAIDAKRTEHPGKIAWVSESSNEPPQVFQLQRGEYNQPLKQVQAAALSILDEEQNPALFNTSTTQINRTSGRRLAFARWLTRPNSKAASLLARVTVNRIWQHHFGTGISATSDNLGYSGATPTHPELLDWLAHQFVASGWSIKQLHRLILTSATYRQASVPNPTAQKIDPENSLLWRYPLRRLDAESVRDSMLAASGELDSRMGGPYVPTSRRSVSEVIVDESTDGAHRRSIYLQHRRSQIESVLTTFDAPSVIFNCTRRDSTTVPLQSLTLLNSEFVRHRAQALAQRLQRDVGDNLDARLNHAFLLVYGRQSTDAEHDESQAFLADQPKNYPGREDAEQLAWIDFCQMLLASNAFLYVE